LSEHQSSTKTRAYRMSKRADNVNETRQRIVEATVELHETVGLAETSIASIAAEAGVTRLTVYRHFPEMLSLFEACSAHWLSEQRPPDPESWARINDPDERLQTGLLDLYRFYREGATMLTGVYRDWHVLPEAFTGQLHARDDAFRDVLLAPFGTAGQTRRLLSAVIGHAVVFPTWQSLCQQRSLSNEEAATTMAKLARTVISE
jgi:AcrR family transcriptional regulator